MSSQRSQIATLRLVYPPMSNQEAVWFEKDVDVEAVLRRSDFYMIGGRAEAGTRTWWPTRTTTSSGSISPYGTG
jgi:hypothetical protein